MGLHVFLHIGLLGEGSATHDALEGLLTCVTECRRHCTCSQWKEGADPGLGCTRPSLLGRSAPRPAKQVLSDPNSIRMVKGLGKWEGRQSTTCSSFVLSSAYHTGANAEDLNCLLLELWLS